MKRKNLRHYLGKLAPILITKVTEMKGAYCRKVGSEVVAYSIMKQHVLISRLQSQSSLSHKVFKEIVIQASLNITRQHLGS